MISLDLNRVERIGTRQTDTATALRPLANKYAVRLIGLLYWAPVTENRDNFEVTNDT